MTVRSDDASADRAALVRLLDGFLSPDYPGRWWEYKVLLAEALRPGGPRAIRRGDRLVVFDGSAVSAVIHLVGPLEDWGDGPGGEP
jgi:hypothetical protein